LELLKPEVIWKWTKRLLPVALGAAGGYVYYTFVGCVTGTCPITSNPWLSTGYGALVGFAFIPWKTTNKERKQN
jgi:Family of unknown function (DUF6132)